MSRRFWTVGFPISVACSLILWGFLFWAVGAFVATSHLRADRAAPGATRVEASGSGSPRAAMNLGFVTITVEEQVILC
ncbi:MAG: hypothetical protein ACP5SH_25300 [Syntrophobacteraceae bacterium]